MCKKNNVYSIYNKQISKNKILWKNFQWKKNFEWKTPPDCLSLERVFLFTKGGHCWNLVWFTGVGLDRSDADTHERIDLFLIGNCRGDLQWVGRRRKVSQRHIDEDQSRYTVGRLLLRCSLAHWILAAMASLFGSTWAPKAKFCKVYSWPQ